MKETMTEMAIPVLLIWTPFLVVSTLFFLGYVDENMDYIDKDEEAGRLIIIIN